MKTLTTLLLAVILCGCAVTTEIKEPIAVDLKVTQSENKIVYLKCNSASFDELVNLPAIDISKYKLKNDKLGLAKDALGKLKQVRLLTNIAKRDLEKCLSKTGN